MKLGMMLRDWGIANAKRKKPAEAIPGLKVMYQSYSSFRAKKGISEDMEVPGKMR